MLLRDLTIENFRSFEKYRLSGLARVNLLVGDNNCGKTSVLEAISLLASEGDLPLLNHLLTLREDTAFVRTRGTDTARQQFSASSLIYRTRGTVAALESGTDPTVIVRGENGEKSSEVRLKFSLRIGADPIAIEASDDPQSRMVIEYYENEARVRQRSTALSDVGLIGTQSEGPISLRKVDPVLFVPAGGLATEQIANIWKTLIRRQHESYPIRALQIVDERIRQLLPLPDTDFRRDILIDRGGDRISLAELGGGAYALLCLGCALGFTAGSTLLLDEIDTGVHYSRLQAMWTMVIRAAQELDIQVFATTHSLDCLRALDEALASDSTTGSDIAIHRIERSLHQAVSLNSSQFGRAIARQSEIR